MNTSFALICSFMIAGSVFLPMAARAQAVSRTEVHPMQTITLSTADFLLGKKKDGKPTTIAGELRTPKPGTDLLPAVIFVHGAGGIGFNYGMWAGELNKADFATACQGERIIHSVIPGSSSWVLRNTSQT